MSTPPPKQVGPVKDLVLTGMLMPWKNGQPSFVHMQGVGSTVFYLPLFDTEETLRAVLARADVSFDSIKHVDDGTDFLDSIPPEIIVILNLRFTDEGRIRFHQVQR